jgi:citrate lyase subunit beta/citryl-CoA lyase
MTHATEMFSARSWLFAPGDSEKKMAKAAASNADIALIDLEDAVAVEEKANARALTAAFLKSQADTSRLWVRINPLASEHALRDLAAVMPGKPGGIMLPKSRGGHDLVVLDHYLSALEAANGIAIGATRVFPLITETAEGMFTTGTYRNAPRLVALTWGAEDLADALGASENKNPDGSYGFTYELARSLCLCGAGAAGVAAIDTIQGDYKDLDGLRKRATQCRRAGFRGMLAIHPAQVDVINDAFMPSSEEIAQAQEIVDLFAANPGVGAIGYKDGMLDRPYLARAQLLLKLAGRA